MTVAAYPMQWPVGWKRTPSASRTDARFVKDKRRITIADGVDRVRRELARMGISTNDLVISTDVPTKLDGFPRSDRADPLDPGAAVYWRDNTKDGWPRRCMAVDRYFRVADNLAAIAATLESMRAVERHGGSEILDRTFTGFTAISGPDVKHWSAVLGVPRDATTSDARAARRVLLQQHHPDKGGDPAAFHAVNEAWDQCCREHNVQETE